MHAIRNTQTHMQTYICVCVCVCVLVGVGGCAWVWVDGSVGLGVELLYILDLLKDHT